MGYAVCGYYLTKDRSDSDLLSVYLFNPERLEEELYYTVSSDAKYLEFDNTAPYGGINRQITELPENAELVYDTTRSSVIADALDFDSTNVYQVIGSYILGAEYYNSDSDAWEVAFYEERSFADPAPSIDWTWLSVYNSSSDAETILNKNFKWNSSWADRYLAAYPGAFTKTSDGTLSSAMSDTVLVPAWFAEVQGTNTYTDYNWDVSYVRNSDGSITFLYFYIEIAGHVWQTRINRTVYNSAI